MSEDQLGNKKNTGTVPKQRIRYTRSLAEVDRLRCLSNSSSDYYYDTINELQSPRKTNHIPDSGLLQNHSSLPLGSINLNSAGSSIPSSSASRKNSISSTLKCDNITKHPNKKQIEDKLNQIHEYLKVTNSLMASIQKVDNQVLPQNDDALDNDYLNIGLNLMSLKEPGLLQRKSENKSLSSPRQNHSNLLTEVCSHKNSSKNRSNRSQVQPVDRFNENEKYKKLHMNPQFIPTQDTESINFPNDEHSELLDVLDFNDTELEHQHNELHKKISELHSKKCQIDQFLVQLQNSGAQSEDVEQQMLKICAMKTQLKRLKNMLDVVKMPVNMQNSNTTPDYEKLSCHLCSGDNMSEKINPHLLNDSNIFRSASNSCIDGRSKQLNKNSKNQSSKPNPKSSLQNELEFKTRELVEIMGKHKINPSNLNQDLGIDTKSDISFLTNGAHDLWTSVASNDSESDRFSNDEFQNVLNEEIKYNYFSPPSTNTNYQDIPRSNFDSRPLINRRSSTPETSRSNFSTGVNKNKSQVSNMQDLQTNQIQKQLEIIKSICDSMMEHQNTQEIYSNIPNFQNNQLDSVPQQFCQRNTENTRQWVPHNGCNNRNNVKQEAGYLNWLTTNNIQTQSFMLNALNQCYQMLWSQQKELALIKSNLSMLQERLIEPQISSGVQQTNSQQSPNTHQDTFMPTSNQFSGVYFNSPNALNNEILDSCINHLNIDQNSELIPNHIWSRQALNNQVVPGNRANNYWDNFRSYSRQNLLSTKNSEVLQNIPSVVPNPFAFIPHSKGNSDQETISHDNTIPKETKSSVIRIKEDESPSKDIFNKDNTNSQFALPVNPNLRLNHENIIEGVQKSTTDENINKSIFEDMKENIYKEVATLISANENRPQFLIQLFKDLQLIKSDNMRSNVLHSIERDVYNSFITTTCTSQPNTSTYSQSSSSTVHLEPIPSTNSQDNKNKVVAANVLVIEAPSITVPTDGDLAEADQSRLLTEDFSEEGAVGGILEAPGDNQTASNQSINSDGNGSLNQNVSEIIYRDVGLPVEEPNLK